eukprot:2905393-Heterocapsa_arctica.AAC.1
MLFSGSKRRLTHTPKRCWRLFWGLQEVIRRGGVSGDIMRILVGHLIHHVSLYPPGLSVLES